MSGGSRALGEPSPSCHAAPMAFEAASIRFQESQPQPEWQPSVEAVVRECVRCLVVEAEQRVDKGPAYFEPAQCYQRRPGKPACQHGAACRQQSGWHWFQYDHPSDHSLIIAPPREFAPLATWRLASVPPCRHYSKTGSCLFGDRCRFEHAPRCPSAPWTSKSMIR